MNHGRERRVNLLLEPTPRPVALPQGQACTQGAQAEGGRSGGHERECLAASHRQRASGPGSAPPVMLGCGYDFLLPLSCRSSSMTVHPEVMTGSGRLAILFGRDWPYFDQRKWPITP
jgi:hypothetical protein